MPLTHYKPRGGRISYVAVLLLSLSLPALLIPPAGPQEALAQAAGEDVPPVIIMAPS